jgi:PRTRC genetic system protein B
MNNLTNTFGTLFHPQKAFLIYRDAGQNKHIYVESYDIDPDGRPYNAHPLSVSEAAGLSKALQTSDKKKTGFLTPKGLIPRKLLYMRTDVNPYAIWRTPPQNIKLLFKEDLGIDSDFVNIPALVWKATKNSLAIYALTDCDKPDENTALFHAPFFNIYDDGHVCMGSVQINIRKDCPLEDFMVQWENAFFSSYFSHMVQGHNPVKGNMVQLWKRLTGTAQPFPHKVLIPMKRTIKHLIQ